MTDGSEKKEVEPQKKKILVCIWKSDSMFEKNK